MKSNMYIQDKRNNESNWLHHVVAPISTRFIDIVHTYIFPHFVFAFAGDFMQSAIQKNSKK